MRDQYGELPNKKIYKYEIGEDGKVVLPKTHQILKIGMQQGRLTMWALVHPDEKHSAELTFRVVPTGGEVPNQPDVQFWGTIFDGPFVWHIFQGF